MIAEVIHYAGRYVLQVGGVYIAMEGDPCRDAQAVGSFWKKETLEDAAKRINEAAAKSKKVRR